MPGSSGFSSEDIVFIVVADGTIDRETVLMDWDEIKQQVDQRLAAGENVSGRRYTGMTVKDTKELLFRWDHTAEHPEADEVYPITEYRINPTPGSVTEVESDFPFTEYRVNSEQIIMIRLAHATRSVHELEAPLAYGLENGKTYTLAGIGVTEYSTSVQVREKLGVWFIAGCFDGVPGYTGLGQSDKATIEAKLVNPTIRIGGVVKSQK